MNDYDDGTFLGGFLLTFILGWLGLLICYCIDKHRTLKGAVCCYLVRNIIIVTIIVLIFFGYISALPISVHSAY